MQRAVWQEESVAFGEDCSPVKAAAPFRRPRAPWEAPSLTSQDLRDDYERQEAARNHRVRTLWDPPSADDLAAALDKELAARVDYKYTTPWQRDVSTENVAPEDAVNAADAAPPRAVYKSLWAEEEMSEARKQQLANYKMETPFSTDADDAQGASSGVVKPAQHYTPTVAPYLQGALPAPATAPPSHPQPPTSLWTISESDLPKKPELESSGDPILDQLRLQLRNSGADGICGLARKFRIMDDDGSGTLNMEEFRKAMKECRLNLTERQLKHLFSYFDKDDSGDIAYDEFLVGIRGVLNKRRKQMVFLAFNVLDKDGSGQVDMEDFKLSYNVKQHPEVIAGKMTEEECLLGLMANFEVGGTKDGIITLEEFESYYSNVSASVDSDDYFELMIRNAWHISGGEGWCANTTNKRVLVTHVDGHQTVEEVKHDLGLKAGDKQGLVARLRAQGIAAAAVNTDGSGNAGEGDENLGIVPAPAAAASGGRPARPSISISQPNSQPLQQASSSGGNKVPTPRSRSGSTSGVTPKGGVAAPQPQTLAATLAAISLAQSQPSPAAAALASMPSSRSGTPRSNATPTGAAPKQPVSLAAMLLAATPQPQQALGVAGVSVGSGANAAGNARKLSNASSGSR